MKRLLPILGILAVLLLTVAPASTADAMTCDHSGTTIASLHHCVMHAYDMGHITNKGVANSLRAKLRRGPGRPGSRPAGRGSQPAARLHE